MDRNSYFYSLKVPLLEKKYGQIILFALKFHVQLLILLHLCDCFLTSICNDFNLKKCKDDIDNQFILFQTRDLEP